MTPGTIDIRLPIGIMFLVLGVILAGYGLVSDPVIYARSLFINVNLYWGLILVGFGGFMFSLSRKK